MAIPIRVLFSCGACIILALGILDCIRNFEDNGCEMTWMFENPQYLNIPMQDSVVNEHPSYSLYVYGEGSYAERIRNMDLRGIPVLFIPGNAGSYKQVRSLGSVSLRMAETFGVKFHFNYFVADFNEELSALYGAYLQKQTEFVSICIKKILSLYRSSHPPTSVILVGHSMGGIVIRALFTLPDFDPKSVNTIITQAAPHQSPVLTVDTAIDEFYSKVNGYWVQHSNSTLSHVVVVSTGGGYRDYQVRSGLTSLDGIVPDSRGISTTTMSVPLAWVSTDHLCSVWCRQMVLTTVKALFDIVDRTALQPQADVSFRSKVFQHHFLHHNGLHLSSSSSTNKAFSLNPEAAWEFHSERAFRIYEEMVSQPKYIAVPLLSVEAGKETDSLTVIANITADHWICTCQIPKGEEKCIDCLSLTDNVRLLPPRYSQRKYLRLNRGDLGKNTHIIVFIPKGSRKVEVIVDKYSIDNRHLVFELPSLYDTIISFPVSITDGTAMLLIPNNTVFYSLHLAGLASPLTAYTAILTPLKCNKKDNPGGYEGSVMTLNVPWSHEDTYTFFRYGSVGKLPIKLQNPHQASADDRLGFEHNEAHLEMYLHPACQYQLRLHMAPLEVLGQYVRFYGALLPIMFVAVLMLALGGQMTAYATDGDCPWMPDAIYIFSKPFYIVPVMTILRLVTSMKPVSEQLEKLGLPPNDVTELTARSLWMLMLPVSLCMLAWLITILHCHIAHFKIAILSRLFGYTFRWIPEEMLKMFSYLQKVLAVSACILSAVCCGALGICVSYVLLIIKVFRLSYLSTRPGAGKTERSLYHSYFLLMLLHMWAVLLNAPVLIVWAKGIGNALSMAVDPSRMTGLIVAVCTVVFLSSDNIFIERQYAQSFRWIIFAVIVAIIPYCLVRIYRINIIICLFLILLATARVPVLINRLSKQHSKDE